ncbi:MAG: methyl-accepting chemotaxis protein [Gemmatimonadetes bacterium]|nr:methyl-accepting chemotaxis protein [Gemmatimonadota bacterium]
MPPLRNPVARLRWTIRRRLLLGSGFTVAALCLIGVGVVLLARAHREMKERMAEVLAVQSDLSSTADAVQHYVVLGQGELLGGGQAQDERMDSVSAVADSVRRVLTTGTALGQAERMRLERIGGLQGRIGARLAMARAFQDVAEPDKGVRQASMAASMLDTLFAESGAIAAAQQASAAEALRRVDATVQRQQWMLRALLALGLVVALAFGVFTWRAVARPLEQLAAAARSMGEGDLTARAESAGLDAEYRVLADAFTETTRRLSALVWQIQRESGDLAGSAAALTEASEQTAISTGEISATMASIAQETEGQLRNLIASQEILESVGDSVQALEQTAEHSRELGSHIQATALGARDEIAGALDTLGRARKVIGASAAEVERLEEASRAVEGFVVSIQEIAGHTNLLALNAAIEAARAGDHGRGFAVVAEEVRKLSTRSAESAQQVRSVVEAMRSQVRSAVASFREGVGGLGDVDAVSRTATEALEGISAAVSGLDELAHAVREAAETNRGAVERLESHLGLTSQHAEAQAAASEEGAAGAEETAATAQEVASTATQLAESATRLSHLVAAFRVDGEREDEAVPVEPSFPGAGQLAGIA